MAGQWQLGGRWQSADDIRRLIPTRGTDGYLRGHRRTDFTFRVAVGGRSLRPRLKKPQEAPAR